MIMALLLGGYRPRLKALLQADRVSTLHHRAKWFSSPPIRDTDHLDDTWESQVRIAPGQDATMIFPKLKPLLLGHGGSRRWDLCLDGRGIRRFFQFQTFSRTWVRSHPRHHRYD